ncbi:MAG: hypothetical protein K9I37_08085 [Crocinitomicaceae bacterium]|nr:hypothetical protein [Crocinitomicaceae bacterium]
MKKVIISMAILLSFALSYGQNSPNSNLEAEVKKLLELNSQQKALIAKQSNELKTVSSSIEYLKKELKTIKTKQANDSISTNSRIDAIDSQFKINSKNTGDKFVQVDDSLSKKSLYGAIIVIVALLLIIVVYLELRRRQKADKTDVIDKLNNTKQSIEESLVKEFEKQTVQIENQINALNSKSISSSANSASEPDHSLALKVASEINLIERNISLMDAGTKGLKQLSRSVTKLKDNLAANGYEMPDLLGKPFHQGMKLIITTSIPDENLEKGSEVISKVLIPQVNYNDKMIQAAQIEVSIGI